MKAAASAAIDSQPNPLRKLAQAAVVKVLAFQKGIRPVIGV
jgi:hypothetical protein